MICPKCGEKIQYKTRNCPKCGEKLPRLSEKQKKYLRNDLIALLLIMMVIFAVALLKDRKNGLLDISVGDSSLKSKLCIGRLLPKSKVSDTLFGDQEVYYKINLEDRLGYLNIYYVDGRVTGYEWKEMQYSYDYYGDSDISESEFVHNQKLYEFLKNKASQDGWVKISEKKDDLDNSDSLYPWIAKYENETYPDKEINIMLKNKEHCGMIYFELLPKNYVENN